MQIDPVLLKQLIETFRTELDELLEAITHGLLTLEKNDLSSDEKNKVIEIIFRSAHNIKGTSRSLGINDVGEIAHKIESFFSDIKKNNRPITLETINLCLETVDKMRASLESFIKNKPLPFNLQELLNRLETSNPINQEKHSDTPVIQNPVQTKLPNPTHHESHEQNSIRVPVKKIEKISSLLEEIQVNKIGIVEHYSELTKWVNQTKQLSTLWKQILFSFQTHLDKEHTENSQRLYHLADDHFTEINKTAHQMHKNMRSRINELSLLSHSLQEEVGLLRMMPIGNLLSTFQRYVRDLSHELHKKVELNIIGDEVKLDKAILEGIKDPLIHLLRNAIDHGIETESVRKNTGKSEVGHITIEITEEGAGLKINVTDDGRGIDINQLSQIAESKNLFTKAELLSMSHDEKLELLFRSGFTTKEIITDISGRGVGLDVVKSNIEELKGHVTISTQPLKGTTFTLRLPLSITTERGLLVQCEGQHFVIPTTSVERVLLLNPDKVVTIQGNQAILLDDHAIPLKVLSEIIRLESKSSLRPDKLSIVVIKRGWNVIALLVDEIMGEREIVIKPLHEPIANVSCVLGGTLLESNQVIIVLEPGDLIFESLHHHKTGSVMLHSEPAKKADKPHILVVDDSITTRTLEKNVLESKNYQVTVAVNGKEAWDILQKQSFSLMITDVMMPIMDGFTLTEQVKKSEKLHHLPVIIVTSLGNDAEKKRGIDVGADAYIVKSDFESEALLEIVSQLV